MHNYRYYLFKTSNSNDIVRLYYDIHFKNRLRSKEYILTYVYKTTQLDRQLNFVYYICVNGICNFLNVKYVYDLYDNVHLTSLEYREDFLYKFKFVIDHYTGKISRI